MSNVYENESYKVVVGLPPATSEMPNPIDAYLIVNKETGVTESWHGILPYAKDYADQLANLLNPKSEKTEKTAQQKFSFN